MNSRLKSWTEVTLGEICEFKYGKSLPEAKRTGDKVPVYGSNGIVGHHNEAITDGMTIVVGRKGSLGEVNLSLVSCWSIDTTYYIDRNATDTDLRWLAYQLVNLKLTELNKSAAVPGLNREDAYRKKLLLPPIAEQKRIATILDKAESLRSLRRQALIQLNALTQSIFLEMFGNPVTNSKGWTIQKFSDVGVLDRGISKNRPRNAPELLGGLYPLIQTGDVANCDRYIHSYISTYSEIGLKQSRMWKAGTLCITIAANIAKTGILTFDACFPDSVVGFQPNGLSSIEYVQSWLSFLQATLEATAPESAQKNINLAILRNLDIPVPPLSLQQEFAWRVEAVEQLKATHRESLAHLNALFASLQHRAFRGEL